MFSIILRLWRGNYKICVCLCRHKKGKKRKHEEGSDGEQGSSQTLKSDISQHGMYVLYTLQLFSSLELYICNNVGVLGRAG